MQLIFFRRASDIEKNKKVIKTKQHDKGAISVSTLKKDKMVRATGVNKAWEPEMKHNNDTEDYFLYAYEDLSIMLDKICFVFFLTLTVCCTVMFLLMLMIGGAQSGKQIS